MKRLTEHHLKMSVFPGFFIIGQFLRYVIRYAIWYHLYNLKNVTNTHGGVLLLVKLQAFSI